MLDVGSVSAKPGQDRLGVVRMGPDIAGQGEELQGGGEVDGGRRPALRQARALWLVVRRHLDIGTKAAGFQIDRLPRDRVFSELPVAGRPVFSIAFTDAELAGVAALRIV